MIVILTLGNLIFQDFEIPEKIAGGLKQGLDLKKYLGGTREIDATGKDWEPISWSGRFRGPTAESRCQALETLCANGDQIKLTWSAFSYQVVISKFKFNYQQPFEIPYSIELEVLSNNTNPNLSILASIDQIFGTDLANSLSLGTNLTAQQGNIDSASASLGSNLSSTFTNVKSAIDSNIPEITQALNTLQTDASTVQTLTGNQNGILSTLSKDIVSAQGVTNTAISSLNGQVTPTSGNVFGSIAGLPPQTIASNVAGQASAFLSLGNLIPLGDTLTKMGKNISNIGP